MTFYTLFEDGGSYTFRTFISANPQTEEALKQLESFLSFEGCTKFSVDFSRKTDEQVNSQMHAADETNLFHKLYGTIDIDAIFFQDSVGESIKHGGFSNFIRSTCPSCLV